MVGSEPSAALRAWGSFLLAVAGKVISGEVSWKFPLLLQMPQSQPNTPAWRRCPLHDPAGPPALRVGPWAELSGTLWGRTAVTICIREHTALEGVRDFLENSILKGRTSALRGAGQGRKTPAGSLITDSQ